MKKNAHPLRTRVLIRWLAVHTDHSLEEIASIMGCSTHSVLRYAAGIRKRNGSLRQAAAIERARAERLRAGE